MDASRLFLIEHRHTDDTCPSGSPEGRQMMAELVLGRDHAERAQVNVVGDYLELGAHRLLILVEAPEPANAERFAEPFTQIGSATVSELGRCEAVMARAEQERLAPSGSA